ncbi:unnamed protein product [Polarella glacialis]|uniref:Mitochondrial distribution and morphology protein 35 n=1 Tax=Polarella glacialis TaxID=89957 RepID=A0A813LEM1_POLGL|nr:unnamed protein product [Polarella glacialis]
MVGHQSEVSRSPPPNCSLGEAVAAAAGECSHLREPYDRCFMGWYRQNFLAGDLSASAEASCQRLFVDYQACVNKHLVERGQVCGEQQRPIAEELEVAT